MASKRHVTSDFRLHSVRQFIESIDEPANSMYYVFAGRHTPFSSSEVPEPNDSVRDRVRRAYGSMVFGKQLTSADVLPMIRRIDYVENTVYDAYDDTDGLLFDRDFYACVDAGAYRHVFKCLDNNGGVPSTVEPDFSVIDGNDEVYQTSDGYRWKYVYSVDDSTFDRFATTNYMPVVANAAVEAVAVHGAIDSIVVESPGEGYDCYHANTFSANDIRLGGNNLVYAIQGPASSVNGYYNGCVLYITSGAGGGEYRRISSYTVNATTKWVVLESPFVEVPTNGSEYEITPSVTIVGDGRQTVNAAARAIIDPIANSVSRVEMLSRGAGYEYASAVIQTPPVIDVVGNAQLRVIHSPPGGHGSDAASELGADAIGISVRFANSESGSIPTSNDFRRIGLLKDPTFVDVGLSLDDVEGDFFATERVFVVSPIRLYGNASMTLGETTIVVDQPGLTGTFDDRSFIFVVDGIDRQLFLVTAASSNATHTTVSVAEPARFTTAAGEISGARVGAHGMVESVALNSIVVDELVGTIEVGDSIMGYESGARATVTGIERGGKSKTFSTFVQAHTIVATPISGEFVEDETVYRDSIETANAILHSIETSNGVSRYYVTEMVGVFNTGDTMIGATSGAQAEVTSKYLPELKYASGEVLYIENTDPIERAPDQSETFKLVIAY